MLKRTLGRSLLILMVVTGFGGTINDSSITQKERKQAITLMKDTRTEVASAVKGLSSGQLNFRAAADKWSVQECIYHIAATEKSLWSLFENSMKGAATPEKRADIKISDEDFLKALEDRSRKFKAVEPLQPANTGYQSLDEAMADFKKHRTDHIKYLKSSTEDLRNHMVQLPFGTIDCYQLCLMLAGHSKRHLLQIEEIKKDPAFPRQ
jgi:hypothetical protein